MGLIETLIVVLVVVVIVHLILSRMPLPEPYGAIVYLIVGLVLLLWVLRVAGIV